MRATRPKFPLVYVGLCFLLVATGVGIDLVDGPLSTRRLVLDITSLVCAAATVVIVGIATRSTKRQGPISTRSKKHRSPPRDNAAGPDAN